MPKIVLLDCPVHSLTMQETLQVIDEAIQAKDQIRHVVVNAAKLVNMKKNSDLRESVISCDIINADGQSVLWAASILGLSLPERVAGIDLMENLVSLAQDRKYKIFFLGAKEEVVEKVVQVYSRRYGVDIVAGYRHGYFCEREAYEIAKTIGTSGADILFVAMTSPKKEIFLNKYKDVINTTFVMGVGGSFDVVAGLVKRAPLWMQRSGLEWFYRVLQEPKRMWKRYLVTNTLFILAVLKSRINRF